MKPAVFDWERVNVVILTKPLLHLWETEACNDNKKCFQNCLRDLSDKIALSEMSLSQNFPR